MADKLSDETKEYIKKIASGKVEAPDYKINPEQMLDDFSKLLIDLGMLVKADNTTLEDYRKGSKHEKNDEAIALEFQGYPKKSLIHTTMLSRDLPLLMEKDEDEKQLSLFNIDVPVRSREKDKRITGQITIDDIIEKDNNITFFDMFHYLGVCRLYNNGDTRFTPDMLVRAAYSDTSKRVTEKQRNEAMKSIDKMMRTVLDIDVSEEYRLYRKIGNDEELTLGENMLYARRAKLKHSNGTISAGYELLRQPVLDVHAFNLSQIDHLENEIMEVSGGKDDALLITYLGSRLATIKNSKNRMGNRILLETIYKHMDLEDPNRQKRAQIKDKIESRLNEWENKGVIKSSKFIKEKGKYHAVEIIV